MVDRGGGGGGPGPRGPPAPGGGSVPVVPPGPGLPARPAGGDAAMLNAFQNITAVLQGMQHQQQQQHDSKPWLKVDLCSKAPKLPSQATSNRMLFKTWRDMFSSFIAQCKCSSVLDVAIPGMPTLLVLKQWFPQLLNQHIPVWNVRETYLVACGQPAYPLPEETVSKVRFVWNCLITACSSDRLAMGVIYGVPKEDSFNAWRELNTNFGIATILDSQATQIVWNQMQQSFNESIDAYHLRFKTNLTEMKELALIGSDLQSENSAVMKFRTSINMNRYPGHSSDTLFTLSTIDNIRATVKSWEEMNNLSRLKGKASGNAVTTSQQGGSKNSKQPAGDAEEQPASAAAAHGKRDVVCFNCGKGGHFKSECKSPTTKAGQKAAESYKSASSQGGRQSRKKQFQQTKNQENKQKIICTWCEKPNHTETKCYDKLAHKPSAEERRNGEFSSSSHSVQAHCTVVMKKAGSSNALSSVGNRGSSIDQSKSVWLEYWCFSPYVYKFSPLFVFYEA